MDAAKLSFVKAFWNGPSANAKDFDIAGLYYQCPQAECHLLITQNSLENVDKTMLFDWGKMPETAIEVVDLDSGAGQYVKGWFFQLTPDQPEVWSADLEIQRLYWATDDSMFMFSLEGNNSAAPIEKIDLVEIANSMK